MAVDINDKSRKLAYQKLERDIDRAIQTLLQTKYEVSKGISCKQKKIFYINEVMTIKEIT